MLGLPVLLLLSLGILVIYSSDPQLALQQAIVGIIGLALFWFFSVISYDSYRPYIKPLYILVIVSLCVVFALGVETRGSVRWIELGSFFRFQPSEPAKLALILLLAQFWAANLPTWKNVIKSFLWVLPVAGLVFKQPDLGTAVTLLAIWLVMLVGANVTVMKMVVMADSAALVAPPSWLFLKSYQRERILSFLSPQQDPLGNGYNVIQSVIAVGSGQLLGRGLGRGTQSRLRFLPEFRTDFVFASISEELGFVGAMIVLVLYGAILLRGMVVIKDTDDKFGSLLVLGVLAMIFFQVTVNIGMNTGILPVTGITLPLLSYGGSSLIVTLVSLSLIPSVARFGRRAMVEGEYLD